MSSGERVVWSDLLTAHATSPRRAGSLRRGIAAGAALYMAAIAAPPLSLVVHRHTRDEHAHIHRGAPRDVDRHHQGEPDRREVHHTHGANHHRGDDHHHGDDRYHGSSPEGVHRHGRRDTARHGHPHSGPADAAERPAGIDAGSSPLLQVDDHGDRAHWHTNDPYSLATIQLTLLLASSPGRLVCAAAPPRWPRLTSTRPTRVRGPPFSGLALSDIEI